MANKSVLDEIVTYLKCEREVFGNFDVPLNRKAISSLTQEVEKTESHEQENPGSLSKSQDTDAMAYFDAQEKLFNSEDGNREIYEHIGRCDTLEELKKLCARAKVLKTNLEATKLVFGVGNPQADLMLVGEAPGAQEDKQGEPFVGKAGQLLNKILAAIDFKREDVYITNILKHRPPNNRNPKPEERQRSLPFLLRQIDLVNPKLVLCLGKVAAQTLLDSDSTLGSMREKFHSFRGEYELMATYHPAALLRHSAWKRPTWEDMQRLRKRYDELDGQP